MSTCGGLLSAPIVGCKPDRRQLASTKVVCKLPSKTKRGLSKTAIISGSLQLILLLPTPIKLGMTGWVAAAFHCCCLARLCKADCVMRLIKLLDCCCFLMPFQP